MKEIKEIAIIGATASGKSDLAFKLALKYDCFILSVDSLSVYKEIDIASAKPPISQRKTIKHFGIDLVKVDEEFNVIDFFKEYQKAKKLAINDKKCLIIVGGSGFYLKSLIDGLSKKPSLNKTNKKLLNEIMHNTYLAYQKIKNLDPIYADKISSNDSYRIQKWYEIYLSTNKTASEYFSQNKKVSINKKINIFEITTCKDILKKRVALRTKKMINDGIIDEALKLYKKYPRNSKALNSIGLKEVYMYLDGYVKYEDLDSLITQKTLNLAKRQITFNKSKFKPIKRAELKEFKLEYFKKFLQ